MKKLKIKTTAYTYLSNPAFPQEYGMITKAIISQPDLFQNIPVEPSVLIDAGKVMWEKTNRASRGGETDRTGRNIQRVICERYLDMLASFVLQRASLEATEQGQLTVIAKSKFIPVSLTRNRSSISHLYPVKNVTCRWTGGRSEVLVRWKRIPGVISYEVEKAFTDPSSLDTIWIWAGSTSRTKIFLDGFPEFSQAWVRVTARGYGEKRRIPSSPAMCTVLSLH